jgi:hypothetical protein
MWGMARQPNVGLRQLWPTGMTELERCAICNHPDKRDLGTSLAHWRDALPGMAYEHITACLDRAACRSRVEAAKKLWPLVEERTDLRSA